MQVFSHCSALDRTPHGRLPIRGRAPTTPRYGRRPTHHGETGRPTGRDRAGHGPRGNAEMCIPCRASHTSDARNSAPSRIHGGTTGRRSIVRDPSTVASNDWRGRACPPAPVGRHHGRIRLATIAVIARPRPWAGSPARPPCAPHARLSRRPVSLDQLRGPATWCPRIR